MPNRSEIENNPFSIATPENLSAEEIVKLFVPYPEFENLQSSGHQFLDGHRGSGKSMMLRMMCPDCQSLEKNNNIEELPYFAVYISIKKTNINNPEYQRIEDEIGGTVISEHLLTHILLSSLISNLQKYSVSYKSYYSSRSYASLSSRRKLQNRCFFRTITCKCYKWKQNL